MIRIAVLALLALSVPLARGVAQTPVGKVSVGNVWIEPALIKALAGVEQATIREKLAGEVRRVVTAAVASGAVASVEQASIDATIRGVRVAPKQFTYEVVIDLKRAVVSATTEDAAKPEVELLATRVVYGLAHPAALTLQVLVSVEEQAEALLRQHLGLDVEAS